MDIPRFHLQNKALSLSLFINCTLKSPHLTPLAPQTAQKLLKRREGVRKPKICSEKKYFHDQHDNLQQASHCDLCIKRIIQIAVMH